MNWINLSLLDPELVLNIVIPIILTIFSIGMWFMHYDLGKSCPTKYEKKVRNKPYSTFLVHLSPLLIYPLLPFWKIILLTIIGYGLVHFASGLYNEIKETL